MEYKEEIQQSLSMKESDCFCGWAKKQMIHI